MGIQPQGPNLDPSASEAEHGDDDDNDSSDQEDSAEDYVKRKEAVLSISKSIVALASSIDGSPLFACTGTLVNHVGSETWILTTATLVRKPGSDLEAYEEADIKIEVALHNESIIEGCLSMCNLLYNIAVITIPLHKDLPLVAFNDIPGYYSLLTRPVIAVGREFGTRALMMRSGEIIRERSKLDCSELMICTCSISEIFEVVPRNCGGIEVGDIISELGGVILNSMAQFTAIFLDELVVAINLQRTVKLQATVHRPRDKTTFVASLSVQELPPDVASLSVQELGSDDDDVECRCYFNNRWRLTF